MDSKKSVQLTVVAPTKKDTISVQWLEVTTSSGNRVIESGHASLIALLKKESAIRYKKMDGKTDSHGISEGILHVERTPQQTTATIIINDYY